MNYQKIIVVGNATAAAKYIIKGREVLVEGRVSVGEKGYFNIIADKIRLGHEPENPDKKTKKQIQNK